MAGFLTNTVNDQVLDCLFGGSAIVPPPTLYVGLSTGPAMRSGRPTEPIGGGYARVAVPNDLGSWPPARWGGKANDRPIRFPAPTGPWGPIRSVFLADSAEGGRVLAMADLATPRAVDAGDRPLVIAPGALILQHA